MIRGSFIGALVALGLSLVVHGGLGLSLIPTPPPVQEAGGATVVRLGDSFQDVAAGVQVPVEPDAAQTPEQITQTAPPVQALDVQQPAAPPKATPAAPEAQAQQPVPEATRPIEPEATKARPAPTLTARVVANAATPSIAPITPGAPVQAQPVITQSPVAVQPVAPQPVTAPPVRAAQAKAVQPAQTLAALPQAEETPAPILSARPALRPRAIEEAGEARAAARRQAAAQTPRPNPPAGRAQPAQTRGSNSGQASASANTSAAGSTPARQAGNAAASNYPGLVARAINRVRKPSIGVTGSVAVEFSIASNGRLAFARVARSSGNAQVDKAAVQIFRRARFPRPPAEARTNYTMRVAIK
ncbi:MAG: TonB family protein [Pseudomonadota bacterium]